MTENLLLLFARFPRAGQVKTRLVPPLDAEGAARLYGAFLVDLVDRLRASLKFSVRIMVAGESGDVESLRSLLASSSEKSGAIELTAQEGADLGARLATAFESAFLEGWKRVMVLGSDHPSIPVGFLERGFELLLHDDLVVGPSEDGGFYALGLTEPGPELFDGLPWSRPELFDVLLEKVEGSGDISYSILPLWYDVDRPEDLSRLAGSREELLDLPRTSGYLEKPEVRAVLNQDDPE